nr:hypothetical protein Ade03nite_63570 [Actinoplanes derwentensis]
MWLVAIGAGVFETVLIVTSGRAAGGSVIGVTVRAVVFIAAVLVVVRMYSGQRWARWVLTGALGLLGTLSLTADPVLWLAEGNSINEAVRNSGAVDLLFGGSRVVHVAAVLCGCVLMFVPSANAYFRTRPPRPAHGPTPVGDRL